MYNESFISLIKNKDDSSILFSIKLPVFYKTLKNSFLVITEKQIFFIDKKVKKILFNDTFKNIFIEENIERKTITFFFAQNLENEKEIKKEDCIKVIAHFKKLNLMTSLFLNLNEKISIEQNQISNSVDVTETQIPIKTDNIMKNKMNVDLYASVVCGNISFLVHSEILKLENLRLLIFKKLSEILKVNLSSEDINLKYFEKIQLYMKCKKKYYKILDDVDLRAGAAFSKNKVELILR